MDNRERQLASPHLSRLRMLTRVFDELIHIPGTRMKVGLDAVIGLLPGGGDLIGGAVSAYALLVATKVGAPPSVILRMAINILIDTVVGAVPLLGDLFDAGWKSNRKNVDLLESYLGQPAKVKRGSIIAVTVVLIVLLAAVVGVVIGTGILISHLLHR